MILLPTSPGGLASVLDVPERVAKFVLDVPGPYKKSGERWFSSAHFVPQKFLSSRPAALASRRNLQNPCALFVQFNIKEADMGFGRGALLWLLGIPLPIILILALFMHH